MNNPLKALMHNYIFISNFYRYIHKMRTATIFLICLLPLLALSKDDKDDKADIGTVIGIDLGTTYSW